MNEHNPTFRYFLHVPYYTLPSDPIEHDLKSLTKELKNVICHNNLGTEGREIRESTINVMAILSYDERFVKFVKRVQLNFLPNYIGLEETVNNILREIHYKLMDNYLNTELKNHQ